MKYKNIVNVPNSMTNLDELLPIMIDMALTNKYGTIHLVNPGAICHDEILKMYKEIIDKDHEWKTINIDEMEKKCNVKAARSNNTLSTKKLLSWYPQIKPLNVCHSVNVYLFTIKCLIKITDSGIYS